jgi:hypothetical protein
VGALVRLTDQKDAIFPVDTPKERMIASLGCPKGDEVSDKKSEVLQGTLDLMVLKTLHALGPLHGFGIARRIEQLSEDPSVHREHFLTDLAILRQVRSRRGP